MSNICFKSDLVLTVKKILSNALVISIILIIVSIKVYAYEEKSFSNRSQIIILNKYAERFCSAKADHFFDGLDNEKTLKYSYFKYIGLQSEEIIPKNMYPGLINQIKEKCIITIEEENELNEFLLNGN